MQPSRRNFQICCAACPVQDATDASLTPQLLDTLRCMLSHSPKLGVALTAANLVPSLLAMLEPAAPISQVKLLEIMRWVGPHLCVELQEGIGLWGRERGREGQGWSCAVGQGKGCKNADALVCVCALRCS